MKKALIASVAAVAAVSAALPAAAQTWGRFDDFGRAGPSARIEQRIETGLRSGQLTMREATMLRRDVARVRDLEWRYGRDGRISSSEARDLDRRYAEVTQRLRFERRDPDRGYGYGYGYNQGGYYGNQNGYYSGPYAGGYRY